MQMQANPNDQFDREYKSLTEKQRAVIDAHAKNPDATNREKARIAGEEILGNDGPVNESYSSDILNNKYPDLADYREEIEQNERPMGTEQTTGNPFEEVANRDDTGFQGIHERPVKGSVSEEEEESQSTQTTVQKQPVQTRSPIQVVDTGDGIGIKLSYRYVQGLLQDQNTDLPDDLHQQLVDVIFQRVSQAN